MYGKLYLCATPIGNLGDITLRTLETLKSVDLIAAEDTRHSKKLTAHFGIGTRLTSYHEHNKYEKGEKLIEKLKYGNDIALISDAGMPAISDPGEVLVKMCIENGIEVVPLPGASAFTTALVASGLKTRRFTFEGFLSVSQKERVAQLENVKMYTGTVIFYEAPHKLLATLKDIMAVFGERNIVIARELTKKFEEFFRTTVSGAIEYYTANPPKGEFVVMIEGMDEKERDEILREELPSPEELLRKYFDEGMHGKELTKRVAGELGIKNREVYDLYLKIKDTL